MRRHRSSARRVVSLFPRLNTIFLMHATKSSRRRRRLLLPLLPLLPPFPSLLPLSDLGDRGGTSMITGLARPVTSVAMSTCGSSKLPLSVSSTRGGFGSILPKKFWLSFSASSLPRLMLWLDVLELDPLVISVFNSMPSSSCLFLFFRLRFTTSHHTSRAKPPSTAMAPNVPSRAFLHPMPHLAPWLAVPNPLSL